MDPRGPMKRKKRMTNPKGSDPRLAGGGKVTRIRKDRTGPAKTGQFKNLVNAARTGQISMVEAQRKIRKLVKAKKSGGKLEAAKKKITDPDYNVMSGRKGNPNQKKAESMGKTGRRAGKVEKAILGGIALTPQAKLVKNVGKVAKRVIKTAKDVGAATTGTAKTQPQRGGQYRMVPKKKGKGKTISGISKRSSQTAQGLRSTPKPTLSALGVAGSKPKKKTTTPTPKPRPMMTKPKPRPKSIGKKKMFMKEASGVSGKDARKAPDSKVEFQSKVMKRKK
tara:strand:+ start:848 stop:1684 length:837 start_codon:yes stop_codon:yes gene_type:complete